MSMATLQGLHALLPGSRLVGDGTLAVERVHSDTRSLRAGDFFVALRGERFDANDFLPQAKTGGAVAALAERGLEAAGLAGLEVADSGAALLALGGAWRAAHTLPLIAVTGSNGKTTVTQMIAAILRAWCGEAALGQRRHRAAGLGLRQEIVGVETLAAQRDEEVAGAQAARVAVHAFDGNRAVADQARAGQQRVQSLQGRHAHARTSSATRASATSENGCFTPAISW